jgi:serine/threonine-protein kinase
LTAGEVVADRFEIVRTLGTGGMAIVYEALDRKLMEARALKFSRPGHLQRIPDETRSALRITHENICRTYEIHSAVTSHGPADFISMELVRGETLHGRLQRTEVSPAEALDIARQLCRGLDAAHKAHIVHQDLKSNNVMLTHRPDGSLRAVITDFGLALPLGKPGRVASHIAGTPNYIAPERWSGSEPAPACDVYALGVILYEILTGRLPFSKETPWHHRLTRLPEPPSQSATAIDKRWDPIVLRCVEPDPSRRFANAGEVLGAVERAFAAPTRRKWLVAAALLAGAAAPVVAFREKIWPPSLSRLAVLPMEGSAQDPTIDSGVRGGLYDLSKRLESLGAASRRLILIPLEDTVRYGVRSPAAAAARLGATHVLLVKIDSRTGGFAVAADVRDCRNGTSVRRFEGDFRAADLSGVGTALDGVVTSAFHLGDTPAAKILPSAYPLYAAGLAQLRGVPADADGAIESLQQALHIDPSGVPALSALSDAYMEKFRLQKDTRFLAQAKAAAQRAQSLQPDSPAVLSAMGVIERYEGRAERALELYRRATELEPNNADIWRRTAIALQQIGRDDEAIDVGKHAVDLAPDYFATHRDLGVMYFRVGRPQDAIEEFRAVTRIAPGLAEGFSFLGASAIALGRDGEALTALQESVRLQPTRSAFNNLAVLFRMQGRNQEAVTALEKALKAGSDDAAIRLNLGNALQSVGRSSDARVHWQLAGDLARAALRANARDAISRARLAYSMARLGDGELAADEALQAAQLAHSDYSVIFWVAMTLEHTGHRPDIFPLLEGATPERLRDLRRQPDLTGLVQDPRFASLLQQAENSRTHSQRRK